jgi:hypothetical protein
MLAPGELLIYLQLQKQQQMQQTQPSTTTFHKVVCSGTQHAQSLTSVEGSHSPTHMYTAGMPCGLSDRLPCDVAE